MKRWLLIRASLGHDRSIHLGVSLGVMIATAVLIGALTLGDSLYASLRLLALQRLGNTTEALKTGDRFFRAVLADEMRKTLGEGVVAPVVMTRATVSTPAAASSTSQVQLLGVDHRFWQLGNAEFRLASDEVALNRYLADRLGVVVGDVLILRFDKPAALPADAVLGDLEDRRGSMRVRLVAVVDDDRLGRFELEAGGAPPANAFVSREALAAAMDQPGRANLLLADTSRHATNEPKTAMLDRALAEHWKIDDVGLSVIDLGDGWGCQLQSRHVFLPDHVRSTVEEAIGGEAVLAYLVNELKVGDHRVPYTVVAAMPDDWFAASEQDGVGEAMGIDDRTIWLNQWAADEQDLAAQVGDELTMRYYVESVGSRLLERTATLRVGHIVPLTGRYVDRALMPPFPGIADAEQHADWRAGVSINLERIRPRDEAYWDLYRGTPRAFISLNTGRAIWGNRFGDTTAIRFADSRFESADELGRVIGQLLSPGQFGWAFQPVREQALAAAGQGPARYFGSLFTGLSFFLILAAIMLTSMIFVFGVEQRSRQIGLLMAVGFMPGRIVRLLIVEGAVPAFLGSLLGIVAALGYTPLLLLGLSTVWSDAVGGTPVVYSATLGSVAGGALIAWAASLAAIWLGARRLMRLEPSMLLKGAGLQSGDQATHRARHTWPAVALCVLGAGALAAWGHDASADLQAAGFIGAGSLTLVAALLIIRWWLNRSAGVGADDQAYAAGSRLDRRTIRLTWAGLSWRAVGRRTNRSLTVIAVLAAGLFLTLSIGANRRAAPADPLERRGPTGGYQLLVNLTHPIAHRLDQRPDGTPHPDWSDSEVLGMRLTAGPQATCDNLNRPARPRLAGIDWNQPAQRQAFAFRSVAMDLAAEESPWSLLQADLGPDVLPAIADQPTLVWALGLTPGQGISYIDERGREFEVRIVAMLEPSVMQGKLLVDGSRLLERYPSLEGYGGFLVRRPGTDVGATAGLIARAHADRGPSIVPTIEVMARFQALENTYLSIFLMLGGLGMVLGSLGLGVVVLRQVMDRRGELALLRAVGFSRARLMRGLMIEHMALAAMGLAAGVAATAVALGPALGDGLAVPWLSLLLVLVMIMLSLAAWIALAAWISTRAPLLEALRNE